APPRSARSAPDAHWALAVVQAPGELAILDMTSNTLAGTVAVGQAPHWSMSSTDGRTAYGTNEGSHDVSVVGLASRTVRAPTPVGNAPAKIALQQGSGAAATPPAQTQAAASPSGKSKSVTLGGVA